MMVYRWALGDVIYTWKRLKEEEEEMV